MSTNSLRIASDESPTQTYNPFPARPGNVPADLRSQEHRPQHRRGARKRLHNSLVCDIEPTGEAMDLTGDGLTIITYTAEPDSPAAEALRFLTSWATPNTAAQAERTNLT